MVNVVNVFIGLLTQKPESLEYLRGGRLVKQAALITFLSALSSSILILLVQSNEIFIFLSTMVFFKIVLIYWLYFSLISNFLLNRFYSGKGSINEILSYLGFLAPLYSLIYTIGIVIYNLPTPPHIIFFFLQIALSTYFIIISSQGLSVIYNQPRAGMALITASIIIFSTPVLTVLKYIT